MRKEYPTTRLSQHSHPKHKLDDGYSSFLFLEYSLKHIGWHEMNECKLYKSV